MKQCITSPRFYVSHKIQVLPLNAYHQTRNKR